MRSSFERLVGRGALLAALGFGGFGSLYAGLGHSGDVTHQADWNWDSAGIFVDQPVGDHVEPEAPVARVQELDWNWD